MVVTARAHSDGRVERGGQLKVKVSVRGECLVVRDWWVWSGLPLVQTLVQPLAVWVPG